MDVAQDPVDTLIQNFNYLREGTYLFVFPLSSVTPHPNRLSLPPRPSFSAQTKAFPAQLTKPTNQPALFSPATLRLLQTHLYSPSSTLRLLQHQALALAAPIMNPLLLRLNALLANSPDIVILVLLVVVFLVAVQVLAWIRRVMLWLTRLVLRLLFWAAVVAAVAVVVQRGPEQTLRDLAWMGGAVAGFAAWLREYWQSEYKRYDSAYR